MESKVIINNVELDFSSYKDKSMSLKEMVIDLFKRGKINNKTVFKALNNISLEIHHGERVGIIGHNGAGKSTLLKTISRIYSPTRGTIEVTGNIAPLIEIGAGFNAELSGRENIHLNGAILGFNKNEITIIEQEIIDFCELHEFIDMPVKYYSTGMYMRLAFAIATSLKPDILILDELFAGGDAAFINKALKRMDRFVDSANILIFVSHQIDLVRKLCSRVVWLDHGAIMMDGESSTVIDAYLEYYK
ncbi:ABC transporter ATP-binding protein [Aeromonas sp. R2-3]|uniref:ABC transporter ATP-binding protein n=1 Tax=Aeromonas sp. R2-3 TaxID=3138461 RepID=UPI0034A366BF